MHPRTCGAAGEGGAGLCRGQPHGRADRRRQGFHLGLFPGTLAVWKLCWWLLGGVRDSFLCTPVSSQDNNGVIGLLEPMKKSTVPALLQLNVPVVKIVSGQRRESSSALGKG